MTRTAPDRKLLILVLVSLAQFMLLIDDTIVNVALPTIGTDLDMSESQLSWVVNAYFLTFGGFLLVGGRAADLLGRRRMLIASLIAFSVASLGAGLATSGEALVAARAVQGLAGALLSPAALSILLATFPSGPERARALGVWAGLTGLGAATGLLAGGVILELLDWRWVFFVNIPLGLAAAAVVPRLVARDGAIEKRAHVDWQGALLGTSGLLLLVYTVVETGTHGWGSARTIGGLIVVALLTVAFVLRERTAPEPLVPPELIGTRRVAVANGVMAVAVIGLFAMFFFLTLYMQSVQGWSALRTGLSFLPFSLTVVVTSAIVSKLIGRIPARPLIVAGLLIAAAGLWMMRSLDPGDGYASALMPMLVTVAFGLGLVFVPILETATDDATEDDAGLASALLTTSQQVGAAVGIAILVTVATHTTEAQLAAGVAQQQALTDGFSAAFTAGSLIVAASAGLALLLGRAQPSRMVAMRATTA